MDLAWWIQGLIICSVLAEIEAGDFRSDDITEESLEVDF